MTNDELMQAIEAEYQAEFEAEFETPPVKKQPDYDELVSRLADLESQVDESQVQADLDFFRSRLRK